MEEEKIVNIVSRVISEEREKKENKQKEINQNKDKI